MTGLLYNPHRSRAEAAREQIRAEDTRRRALGLSLTQPERIGEKLKTAINLDFIDAGLDGNGSFRGTSHGLATINGILNQYGIVLADIVSAHEVAGPSGRRTFVIGFENPEPFAPPIQIKNSHLVFSWYQRESGNYEVLAYVS